VQEQPYGVDRHREHAPILANRKLPAVGERPAYRGAVLGPLHGAFLVISLAMVVVKLFALVDCALRPQRAFAVEGKQTKTFWLVVLGIAVAATYIGLFTIIGLVAALVYLLDVRPAVRAYR
jgi:uncharacterized membrane protein